MPKTSDVTDRYPGAQEAANWHDWPAGASRVIVEPKIDGFRLSTVVTADGVVSFHCGQATPPDWADNLEHIAAAVRATGVRSVMLDGEISAATWNETEKLIKRHRALMSAEMKERIVREVRYHAFDWVPLDLATEKQKKPGGRNWVDTFPVPLVERYSVLEGLIQRLDDDSPLRLVPQFDAHSPQQVFDLLDEFVELEFEGAIVKDPNSPYMLDRVRCWQKLKPMQTLELIVTGAVADNGKHKGRLGALEGTLPSGNKVRVCTGFTDEIRERLWHTWEYRPEALVGKVLEVACQAGDVEEVRHGSFLRFRGDDNVSAAE